MKLVTEKAYREEVERRMGDINDKRYIHERIDRLEKQIYELDITVEKLKDRLEHPDGECELVKAVGAPTTSGSIYS